MTHSTSRSAGAYAYLEDIGTLLEERDGLASGEDSGDSTFDASFNADAEVGVNASTDRVGNRGSTSSFQDVEGDSEVGASREIGFEEDLLAETWVST